MTPRILGLIPCRTNSGLNGKNLRRLIDGSTLLSRAVDVSKEAFGKANTVVSTDGLDVMEAAVALEANVMLRRKQGDGPMIDVVREAAQLFEHEWIALLQPTCPLRNAAEIREAARCATDARDTISGFVSVRRVPLELSPIFQTEVLQNGGLYPYECGDWGGVPTRRQDAVQTYVRDGWLYMIRRLTVLDERCVHVFGGSPMPIFTPDRQSVNIDSEDDFAVLAMRLSEGLPLVE